MKSLLLMLALVASVNNIRAQEQRKDSLHILDRLAVARSLLFKNPDSARAIAVEMLEYSQENDFLWGESQSWILQAATYHRQGKYDTAIALCQNTIDLFSSVKDSIHLGTASLTQGMCYISIGDYEEGAAKTLNSLSIFETIALTDEEKVRKHLPRAYNILGQVYYYQSDFETTEKYFLKYLELAAKFQDTLLIGSANTNLGAVYFEMGEYDRALEHDLTAAEIQKSLGNMHGYANALQNIAVGLNERDEHNKAIEFYDRALKIYYEIPNLKSVTEVYCNLGKLYLETGQFGNSKTNYEKAIELSAEANNPEIVKLSLEGLSLVAAKEQNFANALQYYKKYHALSDSLVNESNQGKIAELQVQYETDQKEREIELLNAQNTLQASIIRQNRLTSIAVVAVIVLAAFLTLLLFRQSALKTKARLEQEKSKLKEGQIKAVIASQEKERRRFAMDLHDDFGQLISALKLNVSKSDKAAASSKSEEILDTMYRSLKNIAFDLMPQTLFEKGLEEAISELKDQVNASHTMRMDFQSFEIRDKIDDEQKVALYRIIQELVSNIIKYANATTINISVTDIGNGISLLVEDAGDGYDENTLKSATGNGWINIQSRLDLLNVAIAFDTQAGRKNSTVMNAVPYDTQQKATT